MNLNEALAFINGLLANKNKQILSELEESLFSEIWKGNTYQEMLIIKADYSENSSKEKYYGEQSLREAGQKLFKKITDNLGIEVSKRNFKKPIEYLYDQYSAQSLPAQEPIQKLTNSVKQDLLQPAYCSQKNHNPFIPQEGRVEDPQHFFGREREIQRVFEVLNSGSSVALIGEEGMGKSSLLWAICQQAKNYLQSLRQPVFLDLNWVHDEDEFYNALCEEVGIADSKGFKLTRNLREKRVLLAIDNLGKFTWEGFTRQVRDQLRGLAEGRDASLRLILAASEPLDKLFNDSQDNGKTSPLAGICQEENMKPWDEISARAFITSRLARTLVNFTEEEIIQLIQESGGHPRKLMQLCYRTYSRYVEGVQ